jgi:hypothetical protein
MGDCKPTQKSGPQLEPKCLSSISSILNMILSVFNIGQTPAQTIPPFLMLVGAELKPGMSGRELAANVISRMESEAGIPMSDIFADGPNAMAAAALVQAQEQISHIQQKASIQTVIKPGAMQISAVGANAGGPIVVQGSNIMPTGIKGVIL